MPGDYVLTFGKKPYSPIKITIPKDANGLYRLIDLQVNKLDSYSNDYEDESDLESQFNQEKVISDSASDSEENLLLLLNDLIQTIITEETPELIIEAIDEDHFTEYEVTDEIDPLLPLTITSVYEQDLSSLEQSEKLHQLRTEIKDILIESNQSLSLKDSLYIAQKINDYYIESYEVVTPNINDSNSEIRTTLDKSLLEHRKMKRKNNISTKRIKFNVNKEVLNSYQSLSEPEE